MKKDFHDYSQKSDLDSLGCYQSFPTITLRAKVVLDCFIDLQSCFPDKLNTFVRFYLSIYVCRWLSILHRNFIPCDVNLQT